MIKRLLLVASSRLNSGTVCISSVAPINVNPLFAPKRFFQFEGTRCSPLQGRRSPRHDGYPPRRTRRPRRSAEQVLNIKGTSSTDRTFRVRNRLVLDFSK